MQTPVLCWKPGWPFWGLWGHSLTLTGVMPLLFTGLPVFIKVPRESANVIMAQTQIHKISDGKQSISIGMKEPMRGLWWWWWWWWWCLCLCWCWCWRSYCIHLYSLLIYPWGALWLSDKSPFCGPYSFFWHWLIMRVFIISRFGASGTAEVQTSHQVCEDCFRALRRAWMSTGPRNGERCHG